MWDIKLSNYVRSEKTKSGFKNINFNNDLSIIAYANKMDNLLTFDDTNILTPIKQSK